MTARTGLPSHIANASSSAGTARGCCAVADSRALSTVSVGPAIANTRVSSHFESIDTHSERMIGLLAARGRCVVHRDRSRRGHLYVAEQVFGSIGRPVSGLMRHLFDLASIEVLLVPRSVIRATGLAALVAATGLTNRLAPRNCGARPTAVPMTVVAHRAQEEDL